MKPLRSFPVIAHALAWAAFFGVIFWPFGFSDTTRTTLPDGSFRIVFGHSPGPLMRYLEPGEIMLLLIPVASTGLAVWLVWSRSTASVGAKLALWGLAALTLAYCAAPFWFIKAPGIGFIGGLSWPAAAVLGISAIIFSLNRAT